MKKWYAVYDTFLPPSWNPEPVPVAAFIVGLDAKAWVSENEEEPGRYSIVEVTATFKKEEQ